MSRCQHLGCDWARQTEFKIIKKLVTSSLNAWKHIQFNNNDIIINETMSKPDWRSSCVSVTIPSSTISFHCVIIMHVYIILWLKVFGQYLALDVIYKKASSLSSLLLSTLKRPCPGLQVLHLSEQWWCTLSWSRQCTCMLNHFLYLYFRPRFNQLSLMYKVQTCFLETFFFSFKLNGKKNTWTPNFVHIYWAFMLLKILN